MNWPFVGGRRKMVHLHLRSSGKDESFAWVACCGRRFWHAETDWATPQPASSRRRHCRQCDRVVRKFVERWDATAGRSSSAS